MRFNALIALGALILLPLPPLFAAESDAIVWTPSVEFGNPADQHLQLDLAMPKGAGPFPAVLCIHGGGFRAGDRQSYDGMCKKLAEHG